MLQEFNSIFCMIKKFYVQKGRDFTWQRYYTMVILTMKFFEEKRLRLLAMVLKVTPTHKICGTVVLKSLLVFVREGHGIKQLRMALKYCQLLRLPKKLM